jgi:hypothetical protein
MTQEYSQGRSYLTARMDLKIKTTLIIKHPYSMKDGKVILKMFVNTSIQCVVFVQLEKGRLRPVKCE